MGKSLVTLLGQFLPAIAKWASASKAHLVDTVQLAGLGAVVAGVYLLAGLAITLLVSGVLLVGLGVLFEKEN